MATGKRIEQGHPPPLDALTPQLDQVIERCLAQDPDERWQSARDVAALLKLAPQSHPTVALEQPRRMWLPWGIAALMTLLVLALAAMYLRETRQPVTAGRSIRFTVPPPENVEFSDAAMPVISPDGEKIAFGGIGADRKVRLWVRPISSLSAEPVPDSEGVTSAFWPTAILSGFSRVEK